MPITGDTVGHDRAKACSARKPCPGLTGGLNRLIVRLGESEASWAALGVRASIRDRQRTNQHAAMCGRRAAWWCVESSACGEHVSEDAPTRETDGGRRMHGPWPMATVRGRSRVAEMCHRV